MLMILVSLALAQCTKDTDCKGDRICSAGVCVEGDWDDAPETERPSLAPVQPTDEAVKAALAVDHAKQLKLEIKELKANLEDATYGGPIVKLVLAVGFGALAFGVSRTSGASRDLLTVGFGIVSGALFLWGGIQFAIRHHMRNTIPDEIAAKERELRALTESH